MWECKVHADKPAKPTATKQAGSHAPHETALLATCKSKCSYMACQDYEESLPGVTLSGQDTRELTVKANC